MCAGEQVPWVRGAVTDADNYVIFGKNGGIITTVALTNLILPNDPSKVTTCRRHGMVYRMDARVRKSDVSPQGL